VSRLLRPWYAVLLALAFFRDLVVSSVQVARTVLAGPGAAEPRFVVVPLGEARTGAEITLVANYITLTPGTLTVDVSPDGSSLLVHSLLAGESGDDIRADIRDGIERRVVRVTRG
jgi:multicomponent Na+:H+ antiporter subunit E